MSNILFTVIMNDPDEQTIRKEIIRRIVEQKKRQMETQP